MTDDRRFMPFAIITAFLVAWLLRVDGIGERTLFWDEAYHVRLALEPSVSAMLDAIIHNPPSDPLYALMLRGWTGLFGFSDPVLRLPTTVLGALSVPAAAWLAWELTRDRRVVLVTAGLVAISPYLIQYGREASLYALGVVATTLALAAGQRWLRDGGRGAAIAALGFAVLACYSHYVAPAVLGLAAAFVVSWPGAPRVVPARQVVVAAVIVAVAWLPWAGLMIATWLADPYSRTQVAYAAPLTELGGAFSEYATGTAALLERVRPVQLIGVAAAGALAVRSWFVARRTEWRAIRVVLLVFAVLLIGSWLASQITGRWLFASHLMLFALPAVQVAVAAGGLLPVGAGSSTRAARLIGQRGPAALALVALLAVQVAGLAIDRAAPTHGNDGTRQIVAAVSATAQPTDPVFVMPSSIQIVFDHYLAQPTHGLPDDVDLRRLYFAGDADASQAQSIQRFTALTSGWHRAWIVYAPGTDYGSGFLDWLVDNFATTLVLRERIGDLYRVDL